MTMGADMKEEIVKEAQALEGELTEVRRELHRHPETGFALDRTTALVRRELEKLGYEVESCGKAGLTATVGMQQGGRTLLLRADMDALPLQEESGESFASENAGKMHGCGHDMHTAMLLGAAKLLKAHEAELGGCVRLMFQPAEEIFQGSADMIENGILENPHVDGAVMLHVLAGMLMETGTLLIPCGGISTASCEQYHITVEGKGGHGSAPHQAIDPITAAAQIHLALQEINSRELAPGSFGVFTTCRLRAGETSNVIPEKAEMWGTIRTVDATGALGEQIKARMTEIADGIAGAMRCSASVEFYDYCPSFVVDEKLSASAAAYMKELFGEEVRQITQAGSGSEDFAFVSHRVPAVAMHLSAGSSSEGYAYGLHHPKVRFDESVLWRGAAAYAYLALRWLQEKEADSTAL